jgi:hypothetical protein
MAREGSSPSGRALGRTVPPAASSAGFDALRAGRRGPGELLHLCRTAPPEVAADSSGNFVVVWEGTRTSDTQGIARRLFDSTGTPITLEEQAVGPDTLDPETLPRVARNDNGFVVVWHHLASIVGNELRGQRFDSNGDASKDFRVAFTTGSSPIRPWP